MHAYAAAETGKSDSGKKKFHKKTIFQIRFTIERELCTVK